VDSSERVFFDSGPGAEGIVGRIDIDGRVKKLVSGAPAGNSSVLVDSRPSAGRLVPDGEGGVIIAAGAKLQRVDSGNSTSTLAGDPKTGAGPYGSGSSGDGGIATGARFSSARSMAVDEAGNLYIADEQDRRTHRFSIRVINRSQAPLTFYPAGPGQVTILPGNIDTIVGKGNMRGGTSPVTALGAQIRGVPPALAVSRGRLYVSAFLPGNGSAGPSAKLHLVNLGVEAINAHAEKVQPGQIRGFVPPSLPRNSKKGPSYIPGMAATPAGDLFLADERRDRVLKLDRAGVLSVFAGRPSATSAEKTDRPRARVNVKRPYDVKVGPKGSIYISDRIGRRLLSADDRGTLRPMPGSGLTDTWTCPGQTKHKEGESSDEVPVPGEPSSVALDGKGNVYFSLPKSHQVKKVDASGTVTTVAGTADAGKPCPEPPGCRGAGEAGPSTRASLVIPTAIALGTNGRLYVFDEGDARVRLANLGKKTIEAHGLRIAPGRIRTIAGTGSGGFSGDGGKAIRAKLGGLTSGAFGPAGSLAIGKSQDLFLVDRANQRVRQIDGSGTMRTIAGKEGPADLRECCSNPVSVTVDRQGNLYVGDAGALGARGPRIWFINRGSEPILRRGEPVLPGAAALVAGNGMMGYSGDGMATGSNLSTPAGMVLDAAGSLYVAGRDQTETDPIGNIIGQVGDVRRIDKAGFMTLIAGNGQAAFNGDGLSGPLSSFNTPAGITVDRCGDLLIADTRNDRIRRLELSTKC